MKTAQETPAAPLPGSLPANGIGMPWLGLGVGAAVGAGGDALLNGFKGWRRTLRRGLTGAATGVGAELGIRAGGELARRHAIAGGSPEAVGATPVVGGLGGAGLGYFLTRDRSDDEEN